MKYYHVEIKDNQAIVTETATGKIVMRSKHFRHRWEAEEYADKWIQQHLPNPTTLEVDNMSISVNQILGGNKHG